MKMRSTLIAVTLASATMLAGCQSGSFGDTLLSAVTVSDAEVKALSDQSCKEMDQTNKVAGKSSKYTKRLNNISKKLGTNINGQPLNYKVYLTDDINAWAMANGCIRVYSGLMDKMTDDEVIGVLGHEIGHVDLGHTKKAFQVAYAAQFATQAALQYGGKTAAVLNDAQVLDFANALINAQFSQSQESEADTFSYDLLKQKKLKTAALATAFDKLAQLDGGASAGMMSSHPGSKERADAIRARIAADGGK
ncbi:M48 family metalloprotease [Budviciaceae bacterium BWR-B9]|uniref:M48 family metalloprotease n=1 Tax=Limnobaculum allomyrinae TaxID=2791986 RepID=A0ABS1ISB6_9GAMM|nr:MULTISPECIES: M48 family metalloprotease [Limnobaculum]MBK5144432.1 M48 family metalloprotease [Limnobaculum allomyrinae]MBV7691823.1 M48 family metalloprotease [Limnobaculum sp. M2-1]